MAKVALRPGDLYARIVIYKNQLNLSKIFSVYVSEEMEKT
jgi:hypothetical protein